jgi:phage regulator Rha-like protein
VVVSVVLRFAVHTRIVTIDIAKEVGRRHSMVERSIEYTFIDIRSCGGYFTVSSPFKGDAC